MPVSTEATLTNQAVAGRPIPNIDNDVYDTEGRQHHGSAGHGSPQWRIRPATTRLRETGKVAGEAKNIEANISTAQSVASQLQASYHIT